MNRLSFFALSCGAMLFLVSGCGGGGSGLTVPAAQSSAIVFSSDRGYAVGSERLQIYRMNADGSNQTRLTDSPQDKLTPHLSRDGKTIVFCAFPDSQKTPEIPSQIYKMNSDGTGVVQLTSNTNTNYSPTISPDGKTIAWSNGLDIWLMDINGNNQRLLSQTDLKEGSSPPSFSPDGTLLAYAGVRNSRSVLIVRTLSNGNEQIIDPTLPVSQLYTLLLPSFSPDGKQIIFDAPPVIHVRVDSVGNNIFLVKTDGSDAKTPKTVFTNTTEFGGLVFNPSGGTLIYVTQGPRSDLPTTGRQIASIDANGFGNKKILTNLGENYNASFAG